MYKNNYLTIFQSLLPIIINDMIRIRSSVLCISPFSINFFILSLPSTTNGGPTIAGPIRYDMAIPN